MQVDALTYELMEKEKEIESLKMSADAIPTLNGMIANFKAAARRDIEEIACLKSQLNAQAAMFDQREGKI